MDNPQKPDSDLGAFVTDYSHKKRILRSLIMLVVGVVLVPIGNQLNSLIGLGSVLVIGVGVIVALIGLFGLPFALFFSTTQVKVYENGFTYRTPTKRDTVLWKDISKVEVGQRVSEDRAFEGGFLGRMQRSDEKLTIHYDSGKKIVFTSASVPGLSDLEYRATRRKGKL